NLCDLIPARAGNKNRLAHRDHRAGDDAELRGSAGSARRVEGGRGNRVGVVSDVARVALCALRPDESDQPLLKEALEITGEALVGAFRVAGDADIKVAGQNPGDLSVDLGLLQDAVERADEILKRARQGLTGRAVLVAAGVAGCAGHRTVRHVRAGVTLAVSRRAPLTTAGAVGVIATLTGHSL